MLISHFLILSKEIVVEFESKIREEIKVIKIQLEKENLT